MYHILFKFDYVVIQLMAHSTVGIPVRMILFIVSQFM